MTMVTDLIVLLMPMEKSSNCHVTAVKLLVASVYTSLVTQAVHICLILEWSYYTTLCLKMMIQNLEVYELIKYESLVCLSNKMKNVFPFLFLNGRWISWKTLRVECYLAGLLCFSKRIGVPLIIIPHLVHWFSCLFIVLV